MDKKKLNLIIGFGILMVGGFIVVNMMGSQQEVVEEAPQPPPQPNIEPQLGMVVIARKDILKNTLITADEVKMKQAYEHEIKPDEYRSIDHVVGKVATVDIIVGERITRGRVMLKPSEQSLSGKVPDGKRAITIPIDKIASLEGMIKPNDRLDVIGMFSFGEKQQVVVPMFEDILVLAVGRTMAAYAAEGGYSTITIALEPKQATLLIFAMQLGPAPLRMLLRSPTDSQKSPTKEPVTMETLWATLFNVQQQQLVAQQQESQVQPVQQMIKPEPEDEIEVYSAGQKR